MTIMTYYDDFWCKSINFVEREKNVYRRYTKKNIIKKQRILILYTIIILTLALKLIQIYK